VEKLIVNMALTDHIVVNAVVLLFVNITDGKFIVGNAKDLLFVIIQ
jgi:hypothetical protein